MARIINSRSAMVFAISFALLVCENASAANRTWLNPAGGTFQTPGNWSAGAVPGAADNAFFSSGATYTVGFTGSVTNLGFAVPAGSVTLNIGAMNTYTLTSGGPAGLSPSLTVGTGPPGPTAQLNITSGTVAGIDGYIVNSSNLSVSGGATLNLSSGLTIGNGSSGSATVQGAGSRVMTANTTVGVTPGSNGFLSVQNGASYSASSTLVVGSLGVGAPVGTPSRGSVLVSGGSSMTNTTTILGWNDASTVGDVDITGAGTTWTTTESLTVGYFGTGNFRVGSGATLSSVGGSAYVGGSMGSSGEVRVTDAGSTWNHGPLYVGTEGTGEVTIERGADAVGFGGPVIIGAMAAGSGEVTVRDAGSTWDLSGNMLSVGSMGAGSLTIDDGGVVTDVGFSMIGELPGSTGALTLSDAGSAMTVEEMFVGGMPFGGGTGVVTINTGATLNVVGPDPPPIPVPFPGVSPQFAIWGGGTVNLAGGTLNTPDVLTEDVGGGPGTFNFFSGTLNLTNAMGTFTVGTDELLGASVALGPARNLGVAGTTVIESGATLTIDGGRFSTGSLVNSGALVFNEGTLSITGPSGLTIDTGGPLGDTVALTLRQTVNVSAAVNVGASGLLALQGGRLNAGAINNSGRIDLDGAASQLDGVLNNSALVTGDGQLGTLANQASGTVRATGGEHLRFTGSSHTNAGQITLAGGTVEFNGTLTNQAGGDILGRGVLVTDSLTNSGDIAFSSGITDVYGDVTNAGGRITISGNTDTTFWDDVTNNGALFKVAPGSSVTFMGAYGGSGSIIATGATMNLEADVSPGNSPAEVNFDGDVSFGPLATLHIELGGTAKGAQYDALTIAGEAALDGALEVTLLDLGAGQFAPELGDTFEILTAAGGLAGSFADGLFPALGGFRAWDAFYGDDGLVLAVVPSLAGDFNGDGVVDAADYVVLRKTFGQSGLGLVADGNRSGIIDQGDFDVWRANFGQRAPIDSRLGSSHHSSVPEPTGALLLVLGGVLGIWKRHRRTSPTATCQPGPSGLRHEELPASHA